MGKNTLKVCFSAADVPSLTVEEAPDGVVHTTKLSKEAREELTADIQDEGNKFALDLQWP